MDGYETGKLWIIMGNQPCGYDFDRPEDAQLAAAAPELYEALEEARRIIAEERDVMVDCATTPPDHDIATLDPMTKPYVDEYDAALAKIAAALAKARGETPKEQKS